MNFLSAPPNIMLRDNDEIVLIDFGLARQMHADVTTTSTGMLRGSPYYMSPEQAQGLPLDARSDLYSLGIVLFEMLTGRKPFTGTSAIEVLQRHVTAPVPQLPAHASLQPLLERLLAKTPAKRFASAEELLVALAKATGAGTAREVAPPGGGDQADEDRGDDPQDAPNAALA